MRGTCPRSPLMGTGWLEGWRLTFAGGDLGWESAVTTVVESPVERVFTALYELDSFDQGVLDELEGYTAGLYRRLQTHATTTEGIQPVWVYVFDGFEGGLPSQWYLDELVRSAEAGGAPTEYIDSLRKRPTSDYGF